MISDWLIQKARNINLINFCYSENMKIIREGTTQTFFENPFRTEKNPSFNIFLTREGIYKAKDFGNEGVRAMDSIEFVQKLKGFNFKDAVHYLLDAQGFGKEMEASPLPSERSCLQGRIEIRKLLPLQNRALINYLKFRKINTDFAQRCPLLYECYYRPNGKTRSNGRDFFCLAFQNVENGYDLRSATFKGKVGTNAYSFIPNENSRHIAVFEGFTDYLSALTFYKTPHSNHNVLILNSTENKLKALPKMQAFDKVFLFLDNDNTGRKTTAFLRKNLYDSVDKATLYQEFSDFNSYLCHKL